MWIRVDHSKTFTILLVLLIVLCWVVLSIWSISPFAPWLGHEIMEDIPLTFSQEYLLLLFVFVIGWILMTIAMMLPTTLPLFVMFQQMTHKRPDHARLIGLLVAGYLVVWMSFGVITHLGDLLIHEIVRQVGWLETNEWIIVAILFAIAGVYQFMPLKYQCLDKCRSPRSFILEHWQGRNQHRHAFLMGVHQGLFCLGCCWSLMLLMFAVSVGNLLWMLLLGMIMSTEKNLPWGRQLAKPLGGTLLSFSMLIVLVELVSFANL